MSPLPTTFDTLEPTAPQWIVSQVVMPLAIGGGIALFLTGVATAMAVSQLRKMKTRKPAIPFTRPLLILATVTNFLSAVFYHWLDVSQQVSQQRALSELLAMRIPAVIGPLFTIISTCTIQTFFAIRCWRLIHRSKLFAVAAASSIALSLSGGIWGIPVYVLMSRGELSSHALLTPTMVGVAAGLFADLLIVVVLTFKLRQLKKETGKRTSFALSSIIRLAFETFALPFIVLLVGIILKLATYRTAWLWNLWGVTQASISSVYLISFVYCLRSTAVLQENAQSLSATDFSVRDQRVVRKATPSDSPVARFAKELKYADHDPLDPNEGPTPDEEQEIGVMDMFKNAAPTRPDMALIRSKTMST